MKTCIMTALLALSVSVPAMADVGVSINIGEPGFYGRLDIGNAPQPRLIYAQPVIIEHVAVRTAPLYLRVPPGQEKHWDRYCGADRTSVVEGKRVSVRVTLGGRRCI